MIPFPPTLYEVLQRGCSLLAPCLQLGLTYTFSTPIRIEGHFHLFCSLTQSMTILWDSVISTSAQATQFDWNALVLITGSNVLLGCLVLWRVSQSLFLWAIFLWSAVVNLYLSKRWPPMAVPGPDYVFLWSFAVSHWIVSVAMPNRRPESLNCHSLCNTSVDHNLNNWVVLECDV